MAKAQKMQFKASQIASSSVLSAVTGEIRRLFIDMFPVDFFNNIRILNAAVSVQDNEGAKDRLKQYRKNNPLLAIRTNISYQKDTLGQYPSNPIPFMYDNWGPNDHRMSIWNIPDKFQQLKCDLAYFKVNAEIGIRVESFVQAADIIGYLNYKVFPGNYFRIPKAPLLVEIPMSILVRSAAHLGINIKTKAGLRQYLDLLKHSSILPLDIKWKKDSGKAILSFLMYATILCKVDELPDPEVNKVGRVQDNAKIAFSMTAQVAFPRSFTLYTEDTLEGEKIEDTGRIDIDNTFANSAFTGRPEIMLNYAINTNPPPFYNEHSSARLIWFRSFITERDEEFDELELEKAIPPYVCAFIDDMLKQHEIGDLKKLVMFRLWRDEVEVNDQLFYFDFRKKRFVIEKPLRNQIYRLGLYVEADKLQPYFAKLNGTENINEHFDKDLLGYEQ